MNNYVVGIGEILWDMLPEGKKLGGAPANFAYHCCQFGLDAICVSAVGKDTLADEIHKELNERNLNADLEVVDYPTGVVNVNLDESGIPCYDIIEGVAYDNIHWTSGLAEIARNTKAVCFGTLAQRNGVTRATIERFLDEMPSDGTLRIFDINLRQNYYSRELVENSLRKCNVLKINDEELIVVSDMLELPYDDTKTICRHLMSEYALAVLILTCGTDGSHVFSQDGYSFYETPKVKVADTVGAGDSFTATMCAGIMKGIALSKVHEHAVKVSAYVCTRNGAMPSLAPELLDW